MTRELGLVVSSAVGVEGHPLNACRAATWSPAHAGASHVLETKGHLYDTLDGAPRPTQSGGSCIGLARKTMTRRGVKRAPILALVANLALWSSDVDAFGVGLGATRATTTMGMGNSFGRLFRISTWGESHGGGVGVNLDGCPPKIPLSAEDIQVGVCVTFVRLWLSRIVRVALFMSTATAAFWAPGLMAT